MRPLADIRWELFTLLAHGGFVTVVDKMGFDGWLDPVCYERLGAAFKEVHAKRSQFGGRPVQEVGLYFSSRTRDWIGRENPGEYFQSFQGAHKAMLYEHIPWGIVLDENATLETLQRFPVVVLPNVGIVSEKERALLLRYVELGGNLIVTGFGGCYDQQGKLQETTSLEALIGARFTGKLNSMDNWVRFPGAKASSRPAANSRPNTAWTGLSWSRAPPAFSSQPLPSPWANCSSPIAPRARRRAGRAPPGR